MISRITADPLSPEVTTLYAELVAQLTSLEARRSIGHLPGSFVTKAVKGQTYYYFQHSVPGERPRQVYVGRQSRELDALVARFTVGKDDALADRAGIHRLCALVRAGGAATTDAASARVLGALAAAGIFRLGGVLVGTHAFIALGNMLGLRWEHGLLRTQDIDIAGERTLAVAVPDLRADLPAVLDSLEMGFLPVPGLSPKDPSTSFKVRGRLLRVDLLTPGGSGAGKPVPLPRFGASAEPLPYLDYLLEDSQPAAIVDGGGVLVQVPHPARFALHKLIVAQERAAAFQAKRSKDIRQAAQLIAHLEADRPGDLGLAREALESRGASWRRALAKGLGLLPEVTARGIHGRRVRR